MLPSSKRKATSADTACVVLLWDVDGDGDGVSDADEEARRTDPRDGESVPPAEVVVSHALLRTLPSFEDALSIVVGLPTLQDDAAVDLFGNPLRPTVTKEGLAGLRSDLERDGVAALDGKHSLHAMNALALLDAALQTGADMAGLQWELRS